MKENRKTPNLLIREVNKKTNREDPALKTKTSICLNDKKKSSLSKIDLHTQK